MSDESRGVFERHTVTERFELFDMATGSPVTVAPLEVAGAKLVIGDAVTHDEIRDFKNLMADGHHRFLVTTMAFHPVIARLQSGLFRAGGGLPAFNQGPAEIPIAVPGFASPAFPGALVLTRA